jgi:hypothetical protein
MSNNIIFVLIGKDMKAVVAYVRNYPGICLGRGKNHKKSQDSRCKA